MNVNLAFSYRNLHNLFLIEYQNRKVVWGVHFKKLYWWYDK